MAANDLSFSICIPIYNGRQFLHETLESIRQQTYPHWELILVEDASPEPSADIVEAFAATVPQQVTYLPSSRNQGTARSRDIAIDHASMPLISILDADDLWLADHLESLAKIFTDPKIDFACSGFSLFRDDPKDPFLTRNPTEKNRADLRAAYFLGHWWLPTGAIAFRRQILDLTGPWSLGYSAKPSWLPHRVYSEDRNFLLRVVHSGVTMSSTGKATFVYRKHAAASTALNQDNDSGNHDPTYPYRAWFYNYYGLTDGIPRLSQRRFLGYLNRNAGDAMLPHSPRQAAWFYFRAWCWYPVRFDRLARATLALFRSLAS